MKSKGEKTREEILRVAVSLASEEGLSGLSVGRLAEVLEMSKSGLYAHFGSKESLQLAIVGLAAEIVQAELMRSMEENEPGMPQLCQLMLNWVRYTESGIFRGGCFFAAAALEYDGRPGAVREEIVRLMRLCLDFLEEIIRMAGDVGHLRSDVVAKQLVFELHACTQEANWFLQVMKEPEARAWARRAIWGRLCDIARPEGRAIMSRWAKDFRWEEAT